MRRPAPAQVSSQLPWLAPCTASLVAIACPGGADRWDAVRHDPAAVLLILRHCWSSLSVPSMCFFPALLDEAAVLDGALQEISALVSSSLPAPGRSTPPAFADWKLPPLRTIYHAALSYARLSEQLAQRTARAQPDMAWVAGLLAPLGWLAICTASPEDVAPCLSHPEFAEKPTVVQQMLWGLDHAAIARRLARRWQLPKWLAAVSGHLGLPVEVAQRLGADANLFQIVQLVVGLVQNVMPGLRLRIGEPPVRLADTFGLKIGELELLARECCATAEHEAACRMWHHPAEQPFLPNMLRLALENRKLRDSPGRESLERELDELHQTVERQRTAEADRLQEMKLNALAEFAAGAGHEINNPLAVISGQAQYLLGRDNDPVFQKALQTIVSQAERIHHILRELRQFARPSPPRKQLIDLANVIREVVLSLGELAAQKCVRLLAGDVAPGVSLRADPGQLRTMLTCLVRNAIEAAGQWPLPTASHPTAIMQSLTPSAEPPWVRIRLHMPEPDQVNVLVEDSGPGPDEGQRQHMFDPFYSGRAAGRGRGLGLPTAWRLARVHGGDVRFDPVAGGPTRFVLVLPASSEDHEPKDGCQLDTSCVRPDAPTNRSAAIPVPGFPFRVLTS